MMLHWQDSKAQVSCCAQKAGAESSPGHVNLLPCRFYQHIVNGCEWDFGIVWGHSVSSDLIHWEHMPPALIPSEGALLAGSPAVGRLHASVRAA